MKISRNWLNDYITSKSSDDELVESFTQLGLECTVTPLNFNYKSRLRRQDAEVDVIENGSIYITKKKIFKKYKNRFGGKIISYMMDSWSIFEVDSKKDFEIVSSLLSSKLAKLNRLVMPKKK